MSSALHVRHTREDDAARKNAESNAQGRRYWPGKVPEWLEEELESRSQANLTENVETDQGNDGLVATRVTSPVVLKKAADPRLARLQSKREEEGDEVAAPQIISRRQARDISDDESDDLASASDASGEDDEAVEARREAVRNRLREKRGEQEEVLIGSGEEQEESEESEYETDTDEEQFGRQMLKPIFVSKQNRETIAEREALEREEREAAKREKARLAARSHETREILISRLKAEEEAAKAARDGPKEVGDIDTDDEKDAEGAYDSWKIRELQRIRRDREEREKLQAAEDERILLSGMTEEERRRWERENPKDINAGPKKAWKFMQKYWHKGAFFQEVSDHPHAEGAKPDEIFGRDYSAPTGEDKLNKEILPKVMQVKNFGRRGRTKYTHLLDQDTTARDEYYNQEGIRKPARRLAGTIQSFEKPKHFNT